MEESQSQSKSNIIVESENEESSIIDNNDRKDSGNHVRFKQNIEFFPNSNSDQVKPGSKIKQSSSGQKANDSHIGINAYDNSFLDYTNQQIKTNESVLDINNVSKDEMKAKCLKIFYNFAKFSPEDKDFFLPQQSLMKILKAIGIVDDKSIRTSDIDIVLKRINPNSTRLNNKAFINFIVKIAEKLDSKAFKANPKKLVLKIMKIYFEPFANYIHDKALNGEDDPIFPVNSIFYHGVIENTVESFMVDEEVIILFQNVMSGIKEVYQSYFTTSKTNIDLERSYTNALNSLLDFARDFEITPVQFGVNQLVVYFNSVVNLNNNNITKNKMNPQFIEEKSLDGVVLTLNKFALLLVHLAVVIFNKNNHKDINDNFKNYEKSLLFLEKLEHSKGLQLVQYKNAKNNNAKISLLPKKDGGGLPGFGTSNMTSTGVLSNSLLSTIRLKPQSSTNAIKSQIEADRELGLLNLVSIKQIKLINEKLNNNEQLMLNDFLSLSPSVIEKIERNLENYKNVFESYCHLGDKVCFKKMNLTGYVKFLKDFNLICDLPKETPANMMNRSMSMSKLNASQSKMFLNDHNQKNEKPLRKKSNNQTTYDQNTITKIKESDIGVMFHSLTGNKNFSSPSKTKSNFDKNKGYAPMLEEGFKGAKFNNIQVMQYSKSNVAFKMDFHLFIKSFEIIAGKLYPNLSLDEGVKAFLDNDLKTSVENKFSKPNDKDIVLQKISKAKGDTVMIDLLKYAKDILIHHYLSYCDDYGLMDYKYFISFLKDFNIFPDFVNIVTLKNIFFSQSELFERELNRYIMQGLLFIDTLKNPYYLKLFAVFNQFKRNSDTIEKKFKSHIGDREYIYFDQFCDSLMLIAIDYKNNSSYNNLERVGYLLEKMSHSKGINKSQERSGKQFTAKRELTYSIATLKEKFDKYFVNISEEGKSASFDNLFVDEI